MNTITVTSRGESLTLVLRLPVASGLAVDSVTGIGPELAEVNTTEFSSYASDGDRFVGARMQKRNIVLTLTPMEPDVEGARLLAYKFFPITEAVQLMFESDHRSVRCIGYVEKVTPTIFSNQNRIQISLICPDPYFYAIGDGVTKVFSGYESLFKFPFSNPVGEETLRFGSWKEETSGKIVYSGERPVGCVLDIYMIKPATNISIYNIELGQMMKIDTSIVETILGSPLQDYDVIRISSVARDKYVYLLRDGIFYNIMGALDLESTYVTIAPGVNTIAYTAETGEETLEFSLVYAIAYGGI